MLPKSFALSDDEESVTSIPRDECERVQSDGGPFSLNEYSSTRVELPQLSWHGYCNCPDALTLSNTGETVSITGKWKKGRPYVAGGPLNGSYIFSQIHFHWPSEHLLNERRYDLEMHAVHYKAAYLTEERAMKEQDGTLVLVYLFEVGKEKTSMSKLACSLPMIKNKGNRTELCDSRLSDFIKPFISNYFIYWGSASIAGSNYSLQWLISCSRLCISQTELCDLKELFSNGEGEQPRKQMADSKPTSAGIFLVGGTVNVAFTEGNRSEVRFSDAEESSEATEKSKSCCFLAKYTKQNSSSKTKDSSSPDCSLKKLYLRRLPSQSSRESTSCCRNDKKESKWTEKNCPQPSSLDMETPSRSISMNSNSMTNQSCPCRSRSKSSVVNGSNAYNFGLKSRQTNTNGGSTPSLKSNKDEESRDGKEKKKILKCPLSKSETHDCIGNGCENQLCTPECDRNACNYSRQNDRNECKKEKAMQKKRRETSKCESSSEEDVGPKRKKTEADRNADVGRCGNNEKMRDKEVKEEPTLVPEVDKENVTAGKKESVKQECNLKGKILSKLMCMKREMKESQAEVDTVPEKKAKEMGQHVPIILAPATVGQNQFIMKSVGTMTTHPPPPSYTRGTDIIGEGSDFSGQGPSISSSQIWKREKEIQATEAPEKVDKIINVSENEDPEDLELLPSRRMVAEEGVQVEMGTSAPPAIPTSDDEQSLTSVLAVLAKDPSLGKVVENLSAEAFPLDEENTTTVQSLTNLLAKTTEDRQMLDLLKKVSESGKPRSLDKVAAKASSDKTKTAENSVSTLAVPSTSSNLDNFSQPVSTQTVSMAEEKSVTSDSNKSNNESGSNISIEKPISANEGPDNGSKEPISSSTTKSKHSFIINVLSEITKDPTLVSELVKTSKETPLAGVIAQALRDLTGSEESKNDTSADNTSSKILREPSESTVSTNASTQTLSCIVSPKHSKTFSGSSNIPTKANNEISEAGTPVKAHKYRASREPSEPGVSGNSSKQTSPGTQSKASRNASGLTESTQSPTVQSLVVAEAESLKHLSGLKELTNSPKCSIQALKESPDIEESAQVSMDTSSTCILEEASKNSEVSTQQKGEISLVSVLSKISKDSLLAKELASIFRNNAMTVDTDPSVCGLDLIGKSPSIKDSPLAANAIKQVSCETKLSKTQNATEKESKMSKKLSKGNNMAPAANVKKGPEEKTVVEVLKKVPSDHPVVADLAKAVLVNILYAAVEQSSVPDLGSSFKKQTVVSIESNPSRKISMSKASRQSLGITSRRESSMNRNMSRTLSNRSAQSLTSDQQPIMEFTSSKEQLLIEILSKVFAALPGTADMVKNVSWVDILITALKDTSSVADRLENQSRATILDHLSRESSLAGKVRESYSEEAKAASVSGEVMKGPNKLGGVSAPTIHDDASSLKENIKINVSERVSTMNPDPTSETLADVTVSAPKVPLSGNNQKKTTKRKSPGGLPERPLADNNDAIPIKQPNGSSVTGNKSNKLKKNSKKSTSSGVTKPSKLLPATDTKENETRDIPEKIPAADVLIEVLEKHPSDTEITMSMKNPFVIKLLEKMSREPSLTNNTINKNKESSTTGTGGRAEDKETRHIFSQKEAALDFESELSSEQPPKVETAMKRKSPISLTAETLKDPSVFAAFGGNEQILPENFGKRRISDGWSADKNQPAEDQKASKEDKTAINSIKLSDKDASKDSVEEASVSNPGPSTSRRDHERKLAKFETGRRDQDLVDIGRSDVEKLPTQEDLNKSIKSRRSTDRKRWGSEDTPKETRKRSAKEAMESEEGNAVYSTIAEEVLPNRLEKRNEPNSECQPFLEKSDALLLEALFLKKDTGGAETGNSRGTASK